ncbi:MAG: hypothetical protein SWK76_12740 [Actinomycetota bacterium]|nr:hypothetical protein [Actinomycetota bacterium]
MASFIPRRIEGHANAKDTGTTEQHTPRKALSNICRSLWKRKPLCLFLALLIIYTVTLKINSSNDCTPNVYLPISMIKHGSITLNRFPWLFQNGTPYFLYPYNGNYYSTFGVGTGLFAVPFYLPFLLFRDSISRVPLLYLAKFVASFYVALSAALLFSALRRLTREKWALGITLLYALATPVFCTASQALWSHGTSLFLISLTIYFLVRGEEQGFFTALAGLPLCLSVLVRTTNMIFIPPILIYILWTKRSHALRFLLWLLPAAVITGLYNQAACGAFYIIPCTARMRYFPAEELANISEGSGLWNTPFWEGFTGNLISPSRGLLITAPILLTALFGLVVLVWKRKGKMSSLFPLGICCALAFLAQLCLVAKKTAWTGGISYGNRLLIDVLPFLFILFIPAFAFYSDMSKTILKAVLKACFIVLIVLSLLLQVEGIVSYDSGSWSL